MTEHKADNDHADLSTVAASATASDRDARSTDIHPLPIKALAPIRDAVTPLSDNGTTTMSQSNSILSQLDALDALADLGAASVAQSDPVQTARSASAAPPAYMRPANDTVFALFTELKHDIELGSVSSAWSCAPAPRTATLRRTRGSAA